VVIVVVLHSCIVIVLIDTTVCQAGSMNLSVNLLLWALRKGDVNHCCTAGVQWQQQAVSRCQLTQEAGHRLVYSSFGVCDLNFLTQLFALQEECQSVEYRSVKQPVPLVKGTGQPRKTVVRTVSVTV